MKRIGINILGAAVALAAISGAPGFVGVVGVAQAANGQINIDQELLTRLEGFKLTGYVPAMGTSGVTIATGFDIGAQTVAGMKAMGLSAALVAKLSPYVGLQRADAVAALAKKPLTVTAAEAAAINKAVQNSILKKLIADFNAKSKTRFQDLPSEAQTVIYIVAHQYYDLPGRTPNFFRLVTQGRWQDAVRELQNFGAKDERRNDTLGAYLDKAIKSGKLPAGPGSPTGGVPSPTPTPVRPSPSPSPIPPTSPTPAPVPVTSPTPSPSGSPVAGAPGAGTPGAGTPGAGTPGTGAPGTGTTPPDMSFLGCEDEDEGGS